MPLVRTELGRIHKGHDLDLAVTRIDVTYNDIESGTDLAVVVVELADWIPSLGKHGRAVNFPIAEMERLQDLLFQAARG